MYFTPVQKRGDRSQDSKYKGFGVYSINNKLFVTSVNAQPELAAAQHLLKTLF